jgi:murein DD-endopeptidase MepM/ murein hydrolase activator NlpD
MCVRQRLSSEPDRYRGRRRVPTPPRSRYAAVVTGAVLGAGFVAIGASALPDAKAVDATALTDLKNAATQAELADRAVDAQRATRDNDRTAAAPDDLATSLAQSPWVLPMEDYTFTSPYGVRWNELHAGIDLAAPEGTPFMAVHAGTVKEAGWIGGYGFTVVIDHGDGVETVYGHAKQLNVEAGDKVEAGDTIGWVGSTGHAYGSQLCLETHVDGESTDPVPFLRERGVDIKLQVASIYS